MELKDFAPKPKELKGHFSIEVVDKNTGKVIDSYEDNNLIVNKARFTMAKLLANHPDTVTRPTSGITGFKMGTRGHNVLTDNILEPKPVGQDGYDESREKLFSQEATDAFFYSISWDPKNLVNEAGAPAIWANDTISFIAKGQKKAQTGTEADAENASIPVTILLGTDSVKYTFEISEAWMNGNNSASVVAFTEAGLFTGNDLFSIKCFPAKVKDNQTLFRIHWKIIF